MLTAPSGTRDASASHAAGSACNRYLVVTSNGLDNELPHPPERSQLQFANPVDRRQSVHSFSLPIRSTASSSRGVSTVNAARM
jgi:hypothetical protein